MSIVTTSDIAGPVDVKFQLALLRNAKALCPYYKGTVPAELAENSGTFTAKWRRIENLAPSTTPLTELTGSVSFPTRTGVTPTVTDLTATVQKYGTFMYLSEEVSLINFNGQTLKLVEVLGINAGRSLNRLQRDIVEDNSTAIHGGTATAVGDVGGGGITRSDITIASNALARQDALMFTAQTEGDTNINTTPIRPAFWGFNHPDVTEDVRLLTGFTPVEQYAGQTETAIGEYGTVGPVRFIESTESSIDADSGATLTGSSTSEGRTESGSAYDVYNTVIMGMDSVGSLGLGMNHVKETYRAGDSLPAVQIINQSPGTVADPLNELKTMGWKSFHAGLVLNSNWVRVVRHTASKLESVAG